MPDTKFTFKQFVINQDKCAMKVSTDSVMFGASINTNSAKRILDIGTGTGLLSLMLAQRCDAEIDAIDIDENAYTQASENFKTSKWNNRISVFHISFEDYMQKCGFKYDLIISNPPYFIDAYKSPTDARSIARHMDHTMTMDELIKGVTTLLTDNGRFWLILPYKEGMLFYGKAFTHNLFCDYLIRVKTKADKLEKRLIMSFSKKLFPIEETEIVIQDNENCFTQAYIDLTRDYYLQLNKQRV